MNTVAYLLTAIVLSGAITLALRAVPFVVLKRLRASKFVQRLGMWMPAGILCILAVVIIYGQVVERPQHIWATVIALVVTVTVHLISKRRALLSIALGTTCYVALINFF